MKTKAAVAWKREGGPFDVIELELDDPREHEVLVRYAFAGMCHSDEHLRHGDVDFVPPMVVGHEGSGVIEAVGPGVEHLKPGDHFVSSWMPACGRCSWCRTGVQNLCDRGAELLQNRMFDGTQRLHGHGADFGAGTMMLGTFSQWNVVHEDSCVKVDPGLPLDVIALTACGVPTGWGSATSPHAANVRPGDTVVVYGVGGVGINAVQGAAHAGAGMLVAVDPVALKRETALKLGATHAFATHEEAFAAVQEETWGRLAASAIVTVSLADRSVISEAFSIVGKRGTVVVTSLSNPEDVNIRLSAMELTVYEKRLVGSLFGSGNPHHDIVRMIELWKKGHLRLEELITRRYRLDQINEGYDALLAGELIRGIVEHEH